MNDKERKLWIHNDKNLFNWFNECKIGLSRFIKMNRVQIDNYIQCINFGKEFSVDMTDNHLKISWACNNLSLYDIF